MSPRARGSADPVVALMIGLRGSVPDRLAARLEHFVDHGEPVFAVEQLFDDLDEDDVRIPRALADLLVAAARARGITRFTSDEVFALVDDGDPH